YLLKLHLDLSRGIDHDHLEGGVFRALVFQEGLRGRAPGSVDSALDAPVWLVQGLREADLWRRGVGDRKLYEGVFRQEGRFSFDDLFEMGEGQFWRLDGVSRAMFSVQSGAMVMALTQQPEGLAGFSSFLRDVATFDGELPILMRTHFPELNLSERSLAKWWALTLARLADAPLTEVMSVLETEAALADALLLHFRDSDGQPVNVHLEEWQGEDPREIRERFAVIRAAQDSLNRLSYRCFPSYRPLLVDYQRVLMEWAREGMDKDLLIELVELSETRERMKDLALRGRDFLDYTEISGATHLSGDFRDYMRLKAELKERPRVQKSDPISLYLDTMESVYEKRMPER
ncbi:MAG: hypothetical protein ACQKBU_08050, partial [Verrucomicrobiales bacterium]